MPHIGVLMNTSESEPTAQKFLAVWRAALQELGWVDGRNVKADIRWGSGDPEWYRSYPAELVALSPNAILAVTTAAFVALQKTSRTVPIVFVVVDPVGSGLVSSMARPGGNATGFTVPWLVAGPDDPTIQGYPIATRSRREHQLGEAVGPT